MKTPHITIALGIAYVVIAFLRWCFEVPILFIALLSIAAALFTIADLFNEMKDAQKLASSVFFGSLFFLILSIVSIPFNPLLSETMLELVQKSGDWATLLGLGIVVITVGYKELLKVSSQNPLATPIEIVKQMSVNEYNTMLHLNDVVTQLEKIDRQVFPHGRIHNGWLACHDTLVDHFNLGGPFYDGLNQQLFQEFLEDLGCAVETLATLNNPESGERKLCEITIINIEHEIYSSPYIRGGPTVQDAEKELDKTQDRWKSLKMNITDQYEYYRVK